MISNQKIVLAGQYLHHYQFDKFLLSNEDQIQFPIKPQKTIFKDDTPRPSHRSGFNPYRARKNIQLLFQANLSHFTKPNGTAYKPVFITYTFREDIQDLDTANKQFTLYTQRLNYQVTGQKKAILQYIVVPEFQPRSGRVHYHCVYFNLPYIKNIYDFIKETWGLGFTNVQSLNSYENIIKYVSKYLTKNQNDPRLADHKSYFASKGLKKPTIYRDPTTIFHLLSVAGQPTEKAHYQTDFVAIDYALYKVEKSLAYFF